MEIFILTMIATLGVTAVALSALSFLRRDDLLGLAGMSVMIVAAVPATVYATLTD